MKRILIVLVGLAFLSIVGCNRLSGKGASKGSSKASADSQVNTLKLNFEEETNKTVPVMTNVDVIEPIVTIGTQKPVVVEKESGVNKSDGDISQVEKQKVKIPEEKTVSVSSATSIVKDQPIKIAKARVSVKSTVASRKGAYIRVGNDRSGQLASPRLPIQITAVVFNESKWGRYADFRLYAIPTHAKFSKSAKYLISSYNNIVLVNGQAQLTKFWNGKNIYGHFLGKGNYNIYIYYRIKNRTKKIIYSKGRFWGHSRSYYLRLY